MSRKKKKKEEEEKEDRVLRASNGGPTGEGEVLMAW